MYRSIEIVLIGLCVAIFGCGRTQQSELALVPVPTSEPAATSLVWRELDLDVNGIRSGTAYEDIVKKIGKPVQFKNFGLDECSNGQMRAIYYQGLTIGLEGDARKKNFAVVRIEVMSSKWLMGNRVHVGSTRDEVLQTFGPANDEAKDEGFDDRHPQLNYVTKDNLGGVTFLFESGQLFRVVMQETLC